MILVEASSDWGGEQGGGDSVGGSEHFGITGFAAPSKTGFVEEG